MSFFNLRCSREMTLVVDNSPTATATRSYTRRAPRRRRRYTRRRRGYKRRSFRSLQRGFKRQRRRTKSKFLAAQVNPFDASVDGVKIPDSNTVQSTPVKIEDQWNGAATDANGLTAIAFMPTLVNNRVNCVANTASSWTWSAAFGGGTDSSKKQSMIDNYDLFRACSHGVRVTCSAAPTTITGNLHVAIATTSNFGQTTWTFPTNIADLSNCVGYRKFPLAMLTQQGVTVVNKFLDCTMTQYMSCSSDGYSATGTDNTKQTNGWAAVMIVVEGAPNNTAVLSITEVSHLEAIPKVAAIDTSTPAAPYNVETLQETSRLAGGISPAYTDAESPLHAQQADQLTGGGMWSQFSAGVRSYSRRAAYGFGQRFVPGAAYMVANYMANRNYQNRYGNVANASPYLMGY
nr:MAG: capsid protein [Cressdnaviricota sp.]